MDKDHQLPEKSNKKNHISNTDQHHFSNRILKLNAIACGNTTREDFNVENETRKSQQALEALNVTGGIQQMLAAQMISIHRLQQLSIACSNGSDQLENKQYFTNAAIKLANCFTQQANLLARLQGNGVQKIVVERVDVHHGGQAVVGSINGTYGERR